MSKVENIIQCGIVLYLTLKLAPEICSRPASNLRFWKVHRRVLMMAGSEQVVDCREGGEF